MKNRFNVVLVYAIYALLSFAALGLLLVRPGVIGLRNDWSIPPYSEQLSRMLTDPLHVWYQADLGHSIFVQSGAILGIIFGLVGYIGINGEIFSKFLALSLFSLIGFSMFLLFRKLSRSYTSQFVAGLFYLFNPFVYNLFSAGMLLELVAYALSPLVVLSFLKTMETGRLNYNYALVTALLFVFVGATLQYAVMIFVLLVGFVLFRLGCGNRREGIKLVLMVPTIWLSLNSWWILPFLGTATQQGTVISNIASTTFVNNIAPPSTILGVSQLAGAPNFFIPGLVYSNSFLLALFQFTSVILVIVAFSTVLYRKDKVTLFFAFLAAIMALFISSAAFASTYESFFLARLFRNSYHLFFLVAFSYSILLGVASERRYTDKSNSEHSAKVCCNLLLKIKGKIQKRKIGTAFVFVVIFLVLINSSPFFIGNISNTVHNYDLPSEYETTYNWLSSQNGQFRVIWQPDLTAIVYKPSVEGLSGFYSGGGVDPYIDYSPKPTYGNYFPSDFSQFIEVSLHQAPTKDLAYLLSLINAKYVIGRQDYETLAPTWSYMGYYPELQTQWSNDYTINKLANQNSIGFYEETGNMTILENKLVAPWITSINPENTYVILGDANAFFVLPALPNFDENNTTLIFPSQYSSENQVPSSEKNVIILDYDTFDLVQAYIPSKYKIEPGLYATGIDANTNWVSLSSNEIYTWWWYNYRYTASLDAAALTLTNSNLTIPYNIAESGTYDLWANVFLGSKSTTLTFYVDGAKEATINLTNTEREGFFWEHLTQLNLASGGHIVTILSNNGENVIAKIVMAPQPIINSAIKNAISFMDNKTILVVDSNWNSDPSSVPDSTINIFQNVVEKVQNASFNYILNSPPQISARYYDGWKGVISTNGTGDPSMIIFQSPAGCPYFSAFPSASPGGWNAYNSTLISVEIGSSELTINSILADGKQTNAIAWWQTDTSWRTNWPITIPPNQRAIIQIQGQQSLVTLQTGNGAITLPVTDGWTNPAPIKASSETSTTIITPESENYVLTIKVATGYGYGNLSTKIDNQTFSLDVSSQEQGPVFSYKYIGPLNLTAGYHTISTSGENTLILYSLEKGESYVNADNLFSSNQTNSNAITFEEINPTQYTVRVNASKPFYLVFSESYDSDWVASIYGQQVPDQYHFTANGYANGWYIDKTGTYTITLEFWPQKLFYAGATISVTTLILCTAYVSKDKIKIISKKFTKI